MKLKNLTFIAALLVVFASCQKEVIRPFDKSSETDQSCFPMGEHEFDYNEYNTRAKSGMNSKAASNSSNNNSDDLGSNGDNSGGSISTGNTSNIGITDPNDDEDASKKKKQN
jgi:hypothetical protein